MSNRHLLSCGLLAALAGCAALPAPRPPAPGDGASAEPAMQRGASEAPASAASGLLAQSRAQRADGDLRAAGASLERALRIEPNNAALWLELAGLRFDEGDYRQAEALARKAASLAGNDQRTLDAALRLADTARTAPR